MPLFGWYNLKQPNRQPCNNIPAMVAIHFFHCQTHFQDINCHVRNGIYYKMMKIITCYTLSLWYKWKWMLSLSVHWPSWCNPTCYHHLWTFFRPLCLYDVCILLVLPQQGRPLPYYLKCKFIFHLTPHTKTKYHSFS